MFTSIALLRASSALQNRVTKVFNYLKKTYGAEWPEDALFPAEVVFISNSIDDYQWLLGNSDVHATVEAYGINPDVFDDSDLICNKAEAEALLYALIGQGVYHGVSIFGNPLGVASTSVTSSTAPNKISATTSKPQKPATPAVSALNADLVGEYIAKLRTRAQVEEALRTFTSNKMVTTLVPILKVQATTLDIEVPKGKQAFVIVL
jgi:hypothetical protein